jgi:beta-glucosidase-like glycosyl hydrolase
MPSHAGSRRRRTPAKLLGLLAIPLVTVTLLQAPGATAQDEGQTLDVRTISSSHGTAYPFQDPELSPDERVDDLIARMTLDEKVGLLHQFSAAIIRLGVPQFRTGTEGLHGLSWLGYATVFPQSTGLAMTWNKELSTQIGEVIGSETRAYNSADARFNGVNVWAPVIDQARDPRSGRASEGLGEDSYLAGMVSSHIATGMQGEDDSFYYQSIPTLKHFTAYGQESQRASYSANASPRNLNEYYFRGFRYGIESGAVNGIMTVSGPVNLRDSSTGVRAIVVSGNRITGPLSCTGNEPPPVNNGVPNNVTGPQSGQCADL